MATADTGDDGARARPHALTAVARVVGAALAAAAATAAALCLALALGLPVMRPVEQVIAWSVVLAVRTDPVQRLLGGPQMRRRSLLRTVLGCTLFTVALTVGGVVVLLPVACALVAAVHAQWDEFESPRVALLVTTASTPVGAAVLVSGAVPQLVPAAQGLLLLAGALLLGLAFAGNMVVLNAQRLQASRALERERRERDAELVHAADHDQLTGALGRRGLARHLPTADSGHVAAGTAGLVLDLDGFKPVNDAYGHTVGDAVLVAVVQRLKAALPREALLARTGGDEFLAVVPDVPDAAAVGVIAARLEACLAPPIAVPGHEVVIGVSIGTAWAIEPEPPEALLAQADRAMYEVKHARRTPSQRPARGDVQDRQLLTPAS